MFRDFFAGMEWTALPLFAMGVFLAVFALQVLRVSVIQRRTDLDRLAAMPLDEGGAIDPPTTDGLCPAGEVKR